MSFSSGRLSSVSGEAMANPNRMEKDVEPPDPAGSGLVQRCVIIQKDEKGYGFTVSGDNPVFVASVKSDGAASKAGVQNGDRIVKVNGTLVTSRNHLDVVKLIKSGSYVALTLRGKPNPRTSVIMTQSPSNTLLPKISGPERVTGPKPVDPDIDREMLQQKLHTIRAMYETAREEYEKFQSEYAQSPTDKLKTQLAEKERTLKQLAYQLQQLTGTSESPLQPPIPSNRLSDSEHGNLDLNIRESWQPQQQRMNPPVNIRHVKQSSTPSLVFHSGDSGHGVGQLDTRSAAVARSKSDAATRKSKAMSTFYVGADTNTSEAKKRYFRLKRATSLPSGGVDGSVSDSPEMSPSASPTPDSHKRHNGQDTEDNQMSFGNNDIISMEDEDVSLSIGTDPGPFADIKMLETKPAHMAIFLNYVISNADPAFVLFHIISEAYSRISANTKELRKWAYEIYSTFIVQDAPLYIRIGDNYISQIDNILTTSVSKTDNDSTLRSMFQGCRTAILPEIQYQLADFCNKKDMGMANFYGAQKLHDNMDKNQEVKVAEDVLMNHIGNIGEDTNRAITNVDLATAWALATYLRLCGTSKVDRVQTFMMKDKRSIKFPVSRSGRAKNVKGHQFSLQHYYVTTLCNFCGHMIWGVGYQGYNCQSCDMAVHKQCVDEIAEVCGGKQKKRDRNSKPIILRKSSTNSQSSNVSHSSNEMLGPASIAGPPVSPSPGGPSSLTQPVPSKSDDELAGIPSSYSVKGLVNKIEKCSPTGPEPGSLGVLQAVRGTSDNERRGSTDLNRSGSLNNKGEKSDRPPRRAKSDVDVDSDTINAINQSGSSSASSLSNRSVESPSESIDNVNDINKALLEDPDLDVELELPSLKKVLGDEAYRKLKPKERKRQEIMNELFYTERFHLQKLKLLDYLFNRPMRMEQGLVYLARALFPNLDEMISLHANLVKDMKQRSKEQPIVEDVGDIFLKTFEGEHGEVFRKACAEYCRNQAYALEALKKHMRKEPKFVQFLNDAESNPQVRRLQLKDLVPSQMQRLTKYPLLLQSLLQHSQSNSMEHKRLEHAQEFCKQNLAYVNQAVKECENYHKLKDIQKKLENKVVEMDDQVSSIAKGLDLAQHQHKLIFDGPLTWKIRAHRTIDLHVLLFEDILVLLQKQDDKYILKCQNTNAPAVRDDRKSTNTEERKFPHVDDHKYTHVPILNLQNLLARSVATEKKSFFVVNMSQYRAQMYEFTAATSDMRIKWCKFINERSEELKKSSPENRPNSEVVRDQQKNIDRQRYSRKSRKEKSDSQDISVNLAESVDRLSSLGVSDLMEEDLIQPDQVQVSNAIISQATPISSPLELHQLLRHNNEAITTVLEERSRLLAQLQGMGCMTPSSSSMSSSTCLFSPSGKAQEEEEASTKLMESFVEEDIDSKADASQAGDCSGNNNNNNDENMKSLLFQALGINTQFLQIWVDASVQDVENQLASEETQHQENLTGMAEKKMASGAMSDADAVDGNRMSGSVSQPPLSSSSPPPSSSQPMSQPAQPSPQEQQPQVKQQLSLPMPRDQLKEMAAEMNTILTSLMAAISSGSDERYRLRQELQDAQAKIDTLKERQRQLVASGAVPMGPVSPRSASPNMREPIQQEQMVQQHQQAVQNARPPALAQEGMCYPQVHHVIQEAPGMDEIVENLDSQPTEVATVIAMETRNSCGASDEDKETNFALADDDDDDNVVSVADLPLPDIANIQTNSEESQVISSSTLLDAVHLEDSEEDADYNERLAPKTEHTNISSLSGSSVVTGTERGESMEEVVRPVMDRRSLGKDSSPADPVAYTKDLASEHSHGSGDDDDDDTTPPIEI